MRPAHLLRRLPLLACLAFGATSGPGVIPSNATWKTLPDGSTVFPGAVVAPNTASVYPQVKASPFPSAATTANTAWMQYVLGNSDFTIGFIGESTTQGVGSQSPYDATTMTNRKSWPSYFQKLVERDYGSDCGIARLPPTIIDNNGEWTIGTGWTKTALGAASKGCLECPVGITTSSTWSAPYGEDYDTYEVFFLQSPSGAGNFTVQATGGNAQTGTSVNATRRISSIICTAPTASKNNIITIAVTTSSGHIWVYGVKATNSRKSRRIVFANLGVGGATVADWNSLPATLPASGINFSLGSELTFIMLGGNDASAGHSVSTYLADMQSLINTVSAYSSVIVLPPNIDVVDSANQKIRKSYADAMKAGGLTNCTYLDIFDQMVRLNYPGWPSAAMHSTDIGYKGLSDVIYSKMWSIP